MKSEHPVYQPSIYQIFIKGILDRKWEDWFDGFKITYIDGETLLQGSVSDQAALHGILEKINNLGLTLLSIYRLPQEGMRGAHQSSLEGEEDEQSRASN
jgi:hypothetical protein